MDLHYKQEVTVGGLVLLAIALFVAGAIWLSGRLGGPRDYTRIEFAEAGNLKVGVPVRISGVAVGKVERISLIEPGPGHGGDQPPLTDRPQAGRDGARIISISTLGDAAIAFDPADRSDTRSPNGSLIPGSMEGGLHRPDFQPERPGPDGAARRPGDREQADRGRPARHAGGACSAR